MKSAWLPVAKDGHVALNSKKGNIRARHSMTVVILRDLTKMFYYIQEQFKSFSAVLVKKSVSPTSVK